MAVASDTTQTITRLTPLAEVLTLIEQEVKPVRPRTLEVAAAGGRTLASDAVAPARPSSALALIDGWALAADLTLDASAYAPAQLPEPPQRVEAGQPVPVGADSVAPIDAVRVTQTGAEVLATINPGDGVLPVGGDCDPAIPLCRAGERLRSVDLAAFAAAGIARVTVREPRMRVVPLRGSSIVMAAARLIAGDVAHRGGAVRLDEGGRDFSTVLAADSADAIIAIGGTGAGRNDANVHTLSREGRLRVHGVALTPGETAAIGFAEARPVLLLPGRLDAALAVWLTIGRPLLDRLAGLTSSKAADAAQSMPLARKVTSTIGLAELVPVRRNIEEPDKVEPLATKYLPFSALSRSEGWILVPAESEGYSVGTTVLVRPWP